MGNPYEEAEALLLLLGSGFRVQGLGCLLITIHYRKLDTGPEPSMEHEVLNL